YGEVKKECGQAVFDFLTDLQSKYNQIMESGMIETVLKEGSEKASRIAHKKMLKVNKKLGFQLF
ncbi:MAG: tryptophan--tRNA ligase, partial [Erysipelotrichaceae bacterium]